MQHMAMKGTLTAKQSHRLIHISEMAVQAARKRACTCCILTGSGVNAGISEHHAQQSDLQVPVKLESCLGLQRVA